MRQCHRCGAPWDGGGKRQPGSKDVCGACSAYLHCCLNCRFYEPGAHNECYIPNTEWVGDKTACNFCDEFEFADRSTAPSDAQAGEQARNALDSLFGDSENRAPDSERLDEFRKLFGD
ncbi:MAG TPA: hypothetical protein PLD73_02750 [Candidatus Hydrogenedentes bacterium]|jgi:hypothetical protein|nr:hypothetical protein [Candidatus Hydrogenedentota bacterium]HPJ98009.1 hypothetical protein [Candidatus Hydrogenedentota bacterium]